MKKLFTIILMLMSFIGFSQTICPTYVVKPINFYKPVTANLQVEHFTGCDPENNTITWSIVETQTLWKNTLGDIFVNDATAINNSTLTTFTFTLKLLDNGTTNGLPDPKFSTYLITLNEYNTVPSIAPQTFSINENSSNSTVIGTVVATDPEARQTKTYSIVSGNTGGVFAINATSGVLTVFNSPILNYETVQSIPIVVKVQDNATVPLSAQATITVNILNVNETPVINNQTFNVNENSANATLVGTIVTTDPDAGQTKTFSIESGNTGGTFSINAATGALLVTNPSQLDYETTPSFALVIKVIDNGTPALSSSATVTVNVLNINENPVINNQTFQ